MMVKIGLYWQHDLDLVALYMHPDFEFTKDEVNGSLSFRP